jgi:hypothetical protein
MVTQIFRIGRFFVGWHHNIKPQFRHMGSSIQIWRLEIGLTQTVGR